METTATEPIASEAREEATESEAAATQAETETETAEATAAENAINEAQAETPTTEEVEAETNATTETAAAETTAAETNTTEASAPEPPAAEEPAQATTPQKPKGRKKSEPQTEPQAVEGQEEGAGAASTTGTTNQETTASAAEPQPIGKGPFGDIYDQFKGKAKEAIEFLRGKKSGEAVDVLHHKNVDGGISLVWGDEKAGLAHIIEKHPELVENLQDVLDGMRVVSQSDNRIILESDTHRAVISKMKGGEATPNWLLTAYEKKKPASASSSDIETEPNGKRNGTATPQNGLSTAKDSTTSETSQAKENQTDKTAKNETPAKIDEYREPTEGERIVGEVVAEIAKESTEVVTDKAEMQRVLNEGAEESQFLKTSQGEVYGFVKDGKMYLAPDLINPNTPIHEYGHLWDAALQKTNPELWNRWKDLVRGTDIWNEVVADAAYADIKDNEDLVASEVKSRLTGAEGERRLQEMVQEASQTKNTMEAAQKISFVDKAKRLLRQMWEATKQWLADSNVFRDTFTGEQIRSMSVEDFVNKTLNDFAEGVKVTDEISSADIAGLETPILESKGSFNTLAEAEKWAKENLQGKSYTNRFTREVIYIGNKSISEMLNEKSLNKSVDIDKHLASLQSVPDFIQNGIPAEIHPDTHGRGFDVMRLYSAIKIDDVLYRVKSTVRRVNQGDRYYTYEIQEMELIEESRANREGEEQNSHDPNSSINSITGAKLLEGVKKTNSEELILPENRILNHSVDGETNTGENSAIAQAAADTAAKLGAPVRVVGDVTEITSPSESQTKRMRQAKGWYDPATGEVVVVAPNNRDAAEGNKPEVTRAARVAEETAAGLNTKVNIIHSAEDIPENEKDAIEAIANGEEVYAWFSVDTGEVYAYVPGLDKLTDSEIQSKIAHEVIGHLGMRAVLRTPGKFNAFCDKVWNAMSQEDREKMVEYVLMDNKEAMDTYRATSRIEAEGKKMPKEYTRFLNKVRRAAADEYVAHLAENSENTNITLWQEICRMVREFIRSLGFDVAFTDKDIAAMLSQSRRYLQAHPEAKTRFAQNATAARFSRKGWNANRSYIPFHDLDAGLSSAIFAKVSRENAQGHHSFYGEIAYGNHIYYYETYEDFDSRVYEVKPIDNNQNQEYDRSNEASNQWIETDGIGQGNNGGNVLASRNGRAETGNVRLDGSIHQGRDIARDGRYLGESNGDSRSIKTGYDGTRYPRYTAIEDSEDFVDKDYNPEEFAPANSRFSRVPKGVLRDKLQKELDGEEGKDWIWVYRAARKIDGQYYSPKMTKLKGEMNPIVMGDIEQADEHPELAYQDKNGKWKVDLIGRRQYENLPAVDYDPYLHTSTSPMNDQFSGAYKMPDLVVIRVKVPVSGFNDGYKADKAALPVGYQPWPGGVIDKNLSEDDKRQVLLTRYDMPFEEVDVNEVASMIADVLKRNHIKDVPFNVFSPALQDALTRQGIVLSKVPYKSGRIPKSWDKPYNDYLKRNGLNGDGVPSSRVSRSQNSQRIVGKVVAEIAKESTEVVTDKAEMQRVLNEGDPILAQRLSTLHKAAQTIKSWIANDSRGKKFTISLPKETQIKVKKAIGRDFNSYSITADDVAHAKRNHGLNGEKIKPGDIPLTDADFELIPYILTAPDRVEKGSTDNIGRESIRFIKTLSNGVVVVVEQEYIKSPNDMKLITMWANMSSSKAPYARYKTPQEIDVRNAILSTEDATKIRKDAENAIEKDNYLQKMTVWHESANNAAKIINRTQFLKTSQGEVYGFVKDGKMYLDPDLINPNTPIHEYGHLWDAALQKTNPELWNRWKDLVRGTDIWNEVVADAAYADIKDNEDLVASEVKSRLTGAEGERRLQEMVLEASQTKSTVEAAQKISFVDKAKRLLRQMWEATKRWLADINVFRDTFTQEQIRSMSVEDFVNKTLNDFAEGVNVSDLADSQATQFRFIGEKGARNADKAEGTTVRMDNLKVAEEMEKAYRQIQGSEEHKRMVDASKRIQELPPIEVEPHTMSRDGQKAEYVGFDNATNKETGVTAKFFGTTFEKNHRENGLFEKAIPKLKEAFETAVFAYSEPDKYGDMTRPDGTKHKAHPNISEVQNYVNKLNINGKDYYIRFTVNVQKGNTGIHSQFITNVELYDTENPTKVCRIGISLPARVTFDGILDAKLKRFFELARETEEDFAQRLDAPFLWGGQHRRKDLSRDDLDARGCSRGKK